MISKFFIERPVLANVLAILMVVIGAVALMRLAVAQYPNVVPPTISVTTRYPGASARAVVDTVALPRGLARLPGVGQVNIFGAGQYSMRIWLDPNKLYARSLTTEDVVNALRGQNQQVTAGQLGMPPAPNTQAFQYTLDIAGRFDDVSQFENIVVKTESNGQMRSEEHTSELQSPDHLVCRLLLEKKKKKTDKKHTYTLPPATH